MTVRERIDVLDGQLRVFVAWVGLAATGCASIAGLDAYGPGIEGDGGMVGAGGTNGAGGTDAGGTGGAGGIEGTGGAGAAGTGGTGGSAPCKKVFVTWATHVLGSGQDEFGSVADADTLCDAAAGAQPGAYRAWLSDTMSDAKDHIVGQGPWCLPDEREPVFDDREQLALGPNLGTAINRTETGGVAPTGWNVWTGTKADGTRGANCSDWTSTGAMVVIGRPVNGEDWTAYAPQSSCNTDYHLYCFEM